MNIKNTAATKSSPRRKPLLVDLALQGGGSHGAFTWGVLDRLLEESWLTFDGISGTSAGAMNAAVMTSGYAKGGADGVGLPPTISWLNLSTMVFQLRAVLLFRERPALLQVPHKYARRNPEGKLGE